MVIVSTYMKKKKKENELIKYGNIRIFIFSIIFVHFSVHFYNIFRNVFDVSIYPRPRFASEYGFQSLPIMSSWLQSLAPDEILPDVLSDLIDHRQHYPLGMTVITLPARLEFPVFLPSNRNYTTSLIYFSQLAQAMATKAETELYRSLRNTEHRTMGALYWQLNDVWVAPSWSAIDFLGNHKVHIY